MVDSVEDIEGGTEEVSVRSRLAAGPWRLLKIHSLTAVGNIL